MSPTPQLEIRLPHSKLVVHVRVIVQNQEVDHLVQEGEVFVSQEQADGYKALVGDGLARVTVSKELSESTYGNGGKVMVSVSLTCDQSQGGVNTAITYADRLASYWVDQHHGTMKQLLAQKGITA